MTAEAKARKAANQRFAMMRDRTLKHITVSPRERIWLVGYARDLHGTACTCCPVRRPS